jgi:hypothetical protein
MRFGEELILPILLNQNIARYWNIESMANLEWACC